MTFYSVNRIDGDVLYLEETTGDSEGKIIAGTPVVFQFASETTNFTIESTDAEFPVVDPVTTNNLVGTFEKKVLNNESSPKANEVYFLNGDAFHQANNSLTLPAFRAYIKFSSSAKVLNICIDGEEADGIDTVLQDGDIESVYDLQGRKHNVMQKGMNIIRMSDGRTLKVYVNK